ncbi:MAG: hypothetical protein ACE5Z5_01295 [Candidatus Bathyarchaeia archaeon]
MGEVYKPEDILRRGEKPVPDLPPRPIPRPITPTSLEAILREIESMRIEIAKIKRALRAHGITIE